MKAQNIFTHALTALALIIVITALTFMPAQTGYSHTFCAPKGTVSNFHTDYSVSAKKSYTASFLIVQGSGSSWVPPKWNDEITVGVTDPNGKKSFTQVMSAVVGRKLVKIFSPTRGGNAGVSIKNKTASMVCIQVSIK